MEDFLSFLRTVFIDSPPIAGCLLLLGLYFTVGM